MIEEPIHEITELGTKVVKKGEKNDQPQAQPGHKAEELNHVSTNPKAETKVESIINSQKDSGEIQENRFAEYRCRREFGSFLSWALSSQLSLLVFSIVKKTNDK